MESSKDFGDGKECNSSTESGWTMYLCSPKHSDQSDVYVDGSDDSLASDASSGPIRTEQSWGNGQNGNGLLGNKVRGEDENGGKCFSNEKSKYQKLENEESVFSVKEGEVFVKFNGNVKKDSWLGKRK